MSRIRAHQTLNKIFSNCWDRPALVSADFELTYGQMYNLAGGLAEALKHVGCVKGDCVAIRLPNGILFPLLIWRA